MQSNLFSDEEVTPIHYEWIGPGWGKILHEPFQTIYSEVLPRVRELTATTTVYPKGADVFNAYLFTPPGEVKVVILGQDPYHDGSAHGLSFSTYTKVTPSLRVIFKEMEANGYPRTSPNLTDLAKQGVLLLNTALTVEKGKAGSHRGMGWEVLTEATISYLYGVAQPVVFLLWGKDAQAVFSRATEGSGKGIDNRVIAVAHPQAENYTGGKSGFYGSKCFEETNQYLLQHGKQEIQWGGDSPSKD